MYKIYKQAIRPEVVAEINAAVDASGADGGFEILVPPKTTALLSPFKTSILSMCPDIRWDEKTFVVIRSVTATGNRASQLWHFDNQRKTALVVLKAPESGNNGDLLIRNNLRKSVDSLPFYILSKIFWTNPLTWFFLRIPFIRNRFFTLIPLEAGDVMIFDGGTTYHGNLPVTSGMRRSILIHNDPLFEDAWISKLFRAVNNVYQYKK